MRPWEHAQKQAQAKTKEDEHIKQATNQSKRLEWKKHWSRKNRWLQQKKKKESKGQYHLASGCPGI